MKIMFAVATYWPSQDGVANITGYLAEGLAARNHEVLVYTGTGNGGTLHLPEREVHAGVNIERIRVYVRWPLKIRACDNRSTRKAYLAKIRDYQPDILVIVCSQTWTLDWIRASLCEIECPKVFYCHGYSLLKEHYPYREKLKQRNLLGVWEQYLCQKYYDTLYKDIAKFDLAIYLSINNNAEQYAREHGLTNGKVLENAIEDVFFEPGMKHEYKEESREEEICFLSIANYNDNKNQQMIIEAYEKARIGRSKLFLAGYERNKYLDSLKIYAAEHFREQPQKEVVFHVHLEREQIVALYKMVDVFVCSSKSETWSITAHEAAAAALPIISTDVGIYSEIPGTIIVHSVEEMKDAIERLYYSFAKRKQCGEAAYRWLHGRNCRTADKVDWFEGELIDLYTKKKNCKKEGLL